MHLSGEMSGTFESAQLAARDALGAGARRSTPGRSAWRPGSPCWPPPTCSTRGGVAPRRRPAPRWPGPTATTSLFYVDTLEYLRRGGRIGAAAALLGSALAVKPLLEIVDGRVGTLEKVRTSARALSRLEELAVEAAGTARSTSPSPTWPAPTGPAQLAEHLGRPARGEPVRPRGARSARSARCSARTSGPGMVAVVVAPR